MALIVLLVGTAGRFRRWWLLAAPVVVAFAAAFAFVSGWLVAAASHPPERAWLSADAARLARIERVAGTPVRVQDVSSWTKQANAFTVGFGPSTHVVLWDTLLDGRFSRREVDVVVAHELGHVRSRHVPKALGWTALIVVPVLWLLALATRRRGGVGDPANLPFAFLVLTVLSLLALPVENAVSRRYEAEADWRALNTTRDPAADRRLFHQFARTSLEQPSPPLLDYVFLENHPTLMQRIAMAEAWAARDGRSSRGGPGSP
jgi:STE24 endopeptidase